MFYHGSNHKIEKFTDDFVGGQRAVDSDGPGIYFSSEWNDARQFGSIIYTVNLKPRKIVYDKPGKFPQKDLVWLIKNSGDWKSKAQNWDENYQVGLAKSIAAIYEYNETPFGQLLQVYKEYYKDSIQFVRNASHLKYDAIFIEKEWGATHVVVMNPAIIELVKVEDDRTEEEKNKIEEIKNSTEYVYHGTSKGAAYRIQREGKMKAGQASGAPNAPLFFSNQEQYASTYASRKDSSGGVLLRIKVTPDMKVATNISNEKGYVEYYTFREIPIQEIEIKAKNNWIPISEFSFINEVVRKFVRNTLQENVESNINDNFKKWFSGSKVIDKHGNPVPVHHGTAKKFSKFNLKNAPQPIIWFTSNKGAIEAGEVGAAGKGHIMDLYASIKNPAGWAEYEKYGLGQLIGMGYDGAILPDPDGTFTGFVFEPTQLKSIANKGDWNPADKNIFKEEDKGRQLGKSLASQTTNPFVVIYRAAPMTANEFFDKDYITLSKKFAIEHAENNNVYHEEPYHVLQALVPTKDVYDAYNPGEYFYSGPNKKAKEIYVSKGEDYEGLDEAQIIDESEGAFKKEIIQVAKQLKISLTNYIGGGAWGIAYEIPGNKVLKITMHNSEISNSKHFLGKKNEFLANIYKVYSIKNTYHTAIIMEKLQPLGSWKKRLKDFDDAVGRYYGQFLWSKSGGLWDHDDEFGKQLSPKLVPLFHDIVNIFSEARQKGVELKDVRIDNLGLKNGHLAAFDLG